MFSWWNHATKDLYVYVLMNLSSLGDSQTPDQPLSTDYSCECHAVHCTPVSMSTSGTEECLSQTNISSSSDDTKYDIQCFWSEACLKWSSGQQFITHVVVSITRLTNILLKDICILDSIQTAKILLFDVVGYTVHKLACEAFYTC